MRGRLDVCEFLVALKADVNAKAYEYDTRFCVRILKI
jgi:hypothetical protein